MDATEEEELDLKATSLLAAALNNCVLLYSDVMKPTGTSTQPDYHINIKTCSFSTSETDVKIQKHPHGKTTQTWISVFLCRRS